MHEQRVQNESVITLRDHFKLAGSTIKIFQKDFYLNHIPRSVKLQRFLELIARLTMAVVLMHAVAQD